MEPVCLDCASAIVSVLLKGIAGEAYNIANESSSTSIKQMAEMYALAAGVKLKTESPLDSERTAFNPMLDSSLNCDKLSALGWKGQFENNVGFAHTIQIMREAKLA